MPDQDERQAAFDAEACRITFGLDELLASGAKPPYRPDLFVLAWCVKARGRGFLAVVRAELVVRPTPPRYFTTVHLTSLVGIVGERRELHPEAVSSRLPVGDTLP